MDRLRNRRFRSKKFLKVPDPAAMQHGSAQILIGMVFRINTMIADEILFQSGKKSSVSPPVQRLFHIFQIEPRMIRSEEHTSELQSPDHLVCRLLLEKKKTSMMTSKLDHI